MAAGEGVPQGFPDDLEFNPGGLAVLWAEENSRDALFAAMQRREAYGTSGTRPVVRFFGGWGYPDDLCASPDFAERRATRAAWPWAEICRRRPRRAAAAPRFALWAIQDPGSEGAPGMPLQRIQIVKGWIEQGEPRERVIDVAGSGEATPAWTSPPASAAAREQRASARCGPTRTSTPRLRPSTTRASSRTRAAAGASTCASPRAVDCDDPNSVPDGLAGLLLRGSPARHPGAGLDLAHLVHALRTRPLLQSIAGASLGFIFHSGLRF